MRIPRLFLHALLPFIAALVVAQKQDPKRSDASATVAKYGKVHFQVSCTPVAQKKFDHAVTLFHSFFYPETLKAFTETAETDPTCAMAFWGIAFSQLPNPLVPPWDASTLKRGYDAVEKGLLLNPKTKREREWLRALELFFKDADTIDQTQRTKLYTNAMEQLYRKYPNDPEAAVFFALALNQSADPKDNTFANQRRAIQILEAVSRRQPDHPGVVHYLIHSEDYVPLAEQGLPWADKYARIAPAVPHALHMPSHIYSMMGKWAASIKSNQAAIAAANDYAAETAPGMTDPSVPHCLDFMEYAYLQLGADKEAKALVDQAAALSSFSSLRATVYTAMAAIPARYLLERGAWQEAAKLEPRSSPFAYAQSITYFTRALGAAKTGDLVRADESLDKLRSLRESDRGKLDYWSNQSEILLRAASAWKARAEHQDDKAVRLMRSAADLEDASEKLVAMENHLFPVREQLGYLLLELNRPDEALAEFKASLKTNPNRLRGIYGAAKASELSGDTNQARLWYERLIALAGNSVADRPELATARGFIH